MESTAKERKHARDTLMRALDEALSSTGGPAVPSLGANAGRV